MYISDFFIFGKLTEWRCFVTYLSNDPRIIRSHGHRWSCLVRKRGTAEW